MMKSRKKPSVKTFFGVQKRKGSAWKSLRANGSEQMIQDGK
jgi:hypothetical protein